MTDQKFNKIADALITLLEFNRHLEITKRIIANDYDTTVIIQLEHEEGYQIDVQLIKNHRSDCPMEVYFYGARRGEELLDRLGKYLTISGGGRVEEIAKHLWQICQIVADALAL